MQDPVTLGESTYWKTAKLRWGFYNLADIHQSSNENGIQDLTARKKVMLYWILYRSQRKRKS